MPKNKTQRMCRIDPYDIFILNYTAKQARAHFKERFPDKAIKKVRWFTFRKQKIQFENFKNANNAD